MPRYPDEEMYDLFTDQINRKLYTYNIVAVEGLRCFGWQQRNSAGEGTPLHYHRDCFEIHYVYSGTLTFRVKGEDYLLKSGEVFITFPNEYHGSGDKPFTGHKLYWFNLMDQKRILGLDEEWSQLLLDKLRAFRHRVIPGSDDMKRMIQEVYRHILSDDPYYQKYANAQMLAFLYRLIENEAVMEKPRISDEIQRSVQYMRQHLNTCVTLDKVADCAGLSLSYFKAKFKREVGVSPADYYMNLRIEEAKRLLREGKSVTETAFLLDFASSNYFSVVFRRVTSLTPTQYVKKHQ